MKIKFGRPCVCIQVETQIVIDNKAWPLMSNALDDDLHEYGFYENFAAAEQLWAIENGLAEFVDDWTPPRKEDFK